MNVLYQAMDYKINEIKSLMEDYAMKEDGDFKGSFLELMFLDLFKSILPEQYFTCRGWILNKDGVRTNERDILICDSSKAPSLMLSKESGIIPEPAVVYDIQVKTCMSESKIANAISMFSQIPLQHERRNALLSFNNKIGKYDYLELLCSKHDLFYKYPIINILISISHGYYVHYVDYIPLKNIIPTSTIKKALSEQLKKDIDESFIERGKVWVNDLNINDILNKKVRISKWLGCKKLDKNSNRSPLHHFILGMINTIYDSPIGNFFTDNQFSFSLFTYTIDFEDEELYTFRDFTGDTIDINARFRLEINEDTKTPFQVSVDCSPVKERN